MTKHEEFIQERKYLKNVSPKTIEWHRQSLAWLGIENLTSEADLKRIVLRMREQGLKASSCNTRARSINAYLSWLSSELRIPKLKEEEFLPEVFSAEDISKFARYKPHSKSGLRARLLVLTLADTGLRLSEALNLRWPNVDLDNCLVTVVRKGRKERKVPFSIELRRVLYKNAPRSGEVFVFSTRNGTRISARNGLRDVAKLCAQLNIKRPCRLLHAFRHSWASNAVRQGMNPFVLQRLLAIRQWP